MIRIMEIDTKLKIKRKRAQLARSLPTPSREDGLGLLETLMVTRVCVMSQRFLPFTARDLLEVLTLLLELRPFFWFIA